MTSNAPAAQGDFKSLTGPDKVAALLLAMGKPLAGRLLKHFDAAELKQITRSAADLGSVPINTLEMLIEEFAGQFSAGVDLLGTANEVEQLLTGVLPPEQIADIMSDILGSSNQSTWERISAVPETVLADYLSKEHPQTGALILTRVSPSCAANVVAQLPRHLRNELMRRMLAVKPVAEAAIRILEGKLQEDLLQTPARSTSTQTNARIADIINQMQPKQMEEVLESLAAVRPKETQVLKGLLFSFDDIVTLSPKARTLLFDKVPTERVVLALQGTQQEFRDVVLSSMASRARRLVETELDSGAGASQRDILNARRAIVGVVLEMAGRGEIELKPEESAAD